MRLADLDGVTLDANGTLVRLVDPVPRLCGVLAEAGVERGGTSVSRAFVEEAAYYEHHHLEGRDAESLARLRVDCTAVFLGALAADLPPDDFASAYVGALEFEVIPGVLEQLARLAAAGLELAVVANWDVSLRAHLDAHELTPYFSAIVIAAEVGAKKPAPEPFLIALERLGVKPSRALHVGDDGVDEEGAAAAGLRFAHVPLARLLA